MRTPRAFVAALVLGALPTWALAADAVDPERLAEARALLAAMHVESQVDAMAGVMGEGLARQFAQGKPAVNQRAMQILMEESVRGMKDGINAPGGLMEAMAEAYASQFSFAELRSIREFYASPAGQYMLAASPEVMKQLFPKLLESSRRAAPAACARAKERLAAEKIENANTMTCPAAP
ncbi:MAG: DUF2059 domain-containing protein [Usitatibacter sp.]